MLKQVFLGPLPRAQSAFCVLRHLSLCALMAALLAACGCASQDQHLQVMRGLDDLRHSMTDLSESVKGLHDASRQKTERINGLTTSLQALKANLKDVEAAINLQGEKSREALKIELASSALTNPRPCAAAEDFHRLQVQVNSMETKVRSEGEQTRTLLEQNREAVIDLRDRDQGLAGRLGELTGSVEGLTVQVTTMESQLQQGGENSRQDLHAGLEVVDTRFLCTIAILKETMTANKGAFVSLDRKLKNGLNQLKAAKAEPGQPDQPQAETASTSDVDKFCQWEKVLPVPTSQTGTN